MEPLWYGLSPFTAELSSFVVCFCFFFFFFSLLPHIVLCVRVRIGYFQGRVNYFADRSARGLAASYGLMVNYVYAAPLSASASASAASAATTSGVPASALSTDQKRAERYTARNHFAVAVERRVFDSLPTTTASAALKLLDVMDLKLE
jgi:hypothetical protein